MSWVCQKMNAYFGDTDSESDEWCWSSSDEEDSTLEEKTVLIAMISGEKERDDDEDMLARTPPQILPLLGEGGEGGAKSAAVDGCCGGTGHCERLA